MNPVGQEPQIGDFIVVILQLLGILGGTALVALGSAFGLIKLSELAITRALQRFGIRKAHVVRWTIMAIVTSAFTAGVYLLFANERDVMGTNLIAVMTLLGLGAGILLSGLIGINTDKLFPDTASKTSPEPPS